MGAREQKIYEFGPFCLETGERVLLRAGVPVRLPRKAYETLLLLVERGGHIVEKDEFLQTIWPETFVEEGSLTVNISLLRKTLGEFQPGHQYIETVPRRGYRFVVPVKRGGAGEAALSASARAAAGVLVETTQRPQAARIVAALVPAPPVALRAAEAIAAPPVAPPAHKPSVRRLPLLLAVSVMAAALAIGVYFIFRHRAAARTAAQPRTLAILPFVNLKPDAATDFLGFSLADGIISKLGDLHTLVVRPSSYVYKYRNQPPDPRKAAEDLKADTLLTGTFLKEGDELRISAQLIDVPSNKTLRQYTDILQYEKLSTVQDKVAQRVIAELPLDLTPAEQERLKPAAARPVLAYEYYLRGVDYYYAENYLKAIEALQESVKLDPTYARAWARLGSAYSVHGSLNFGGREFYDRAQAAYEQALKLDPAQPEARAYLADLLVDTGRFERAVPLLRAVLRADPDDALARWELSYAYRFGGRLAESIVEGERSRAADPNLVLASAPFSAYLYTGQYERFIQSLHGTDDSALLTFYRGLGYYYLQNNERASADFDRAYELDPTLLAANVGRALRAALSGRNEAGLQVLRQVEARIEQSGVIDGESAYKVAQAYAVLNDRAAALRMLRRSIESGFVCYPYIARDPLLEKLRTEPAYAPLLQQARTRHEEFSRKFF